jgi:hypothetical protein
MNPGENDETFLDRMNKKLKDTSNPAFTLDEAEILYRICTGDTTTQEVGWIEYCRKWLSEKRDNGCFYK